MLLELGCPVSSMLLTELTAGPELGPPPHIHRNNDESFYILEGAQADARGRSLFERHTAALITQGQEAVALREPPECRRT